MLPVGRVAGHRGRGGELTVRTLAAADTWLGVRRFRIDGPAGDQDYEVESSRAYRNRLVLKLKGVDDASAAAGLRGGRVAVERAEAPELPQGTHYVADLVGLLVVDEAGQELGRVVGVVTSGGADVLRVRVTPGADEEDDGEELLIPLAPEYVRSLDEREGRIVAHVPPDLRELNR